jgi:hypothetical protein
MVTARVLARLLAGVQERCDDDGAPTTFAVTDIVTLRDDGWLRGRRPFILQLPPTTRAA